jgi:DeoR/GlpR family transcriptional regulator of sugar metabolism
MEDASLNERQLFILSHLSKYKETRVHDLTAQLGVSEVTVRRDLDRLQESGHLVRTHGGAIPAEDFNRLKPIRIRAQEHVREKTTLARFARTLIRENETVFLDAGTTAILLARELARMNIEVITNSLDVAVELADTPVSVHSIGGNLRSESRAFIGPSATETLRKYRIDTCVLVPAGVTSDGSFSSQNVLESEVKRTALSVSSRKIALFDHSKYGVYAFSVFAYANEFDIVVADPEFAYAEQLETRGCEITLAPVVDTFKSTF